MRGLAFFLTSLFILVLVIGMIWGGCGGTTPKERISSAREAALKTDLRLVKDAVDAILEIGVQAHAELPEQSGFFLRRVLFDLDTHGTPTGYPPSGLALHTIEESSVQVVLSPPSPPS